MEKITLSQTFIDPVCAMKMFPERIKYTFAYKDHTYYFCDEACRMAFSADPEKYLKVKSVKRKGIWGGYIDRLNKATGGKEQQCH